jgi:hypothetical protein
VRVWGRFDVVGSERAPAKSERRPLLIPARAATSNSRSCSPVSAKARAKRAIVTRCGLRRYPRSNALTPCVLIRARSASSSCERPAASRRRRSRLPKSEEAVRRSTSPIVAASHRFSHLHARRGSTESSDGKPRRQAAARLRASLGAPRRLFDGKAAAVRAPGRPDSRCDCDSHRAVPPSRARARDGSGRTRDSTPYVAWPNPPTDPSPSSRSR